MDTLEYHIVDSAFTGVFLPSDLVQLRIQFPRFLIALCYRLLGPQIVLVVRSSCNDIIFNNVGSARDPLRRCATRPLGRCATSYARDERKAHGTAFRYNELGGDYKIRIVHYSGPRLYHLGEASSALQAFRERLVTIANECVIAPDVHERVLCLRSATVETTAETTHF